MADSELIRVALEGVAAAGVVGGFAMTLVRLGAIGNQIQTHGKAIEKMADVMVVQATQRMELQALRDRQTQDAARTDESFRRVFQLLDRVPKQN